MNMEGKKKAKPASFPTATTEEMHFFYR